MNKALVPADTFQSAGAFCFHFSGLGSPIRGVELHFSDEKNDF